MTKLFSYFLIFLGYVEFFVNFFKLLQKIFSMHLLKHSAYKWTQTIQTCVI